MASVESFLIVVHGMFYSVQSPAVLKSAFQTRPDGRHVLCFCAWPNSIYTIYTALAARVGECRLGERHGVCLHMCTFIKHSNSSARSFVCLNSFLNER